MPYFQTDYITVDWDEADKWVIAEWRGYTGGGQNKVQSGANKILDLLIQKKAYKILTDSTKLHVLDQADQQWFAEIWLPKAVEAGLRYTSNVLPKSVIAKLALEQVEKKLGGFDLERATFPTLEEAKEWLRTK